MPETALHLDLNDLGLEPTGDRDPGTRREGRLRIGRTWFKALAIEVSQDDDDDQVATDARRDGSRLQYLQQALGAGQDPGFETVRVGGREYALVIHPEGRPEDEDEDGDDD